MNIAVDAPFRGRGVARALLEHLFAATGDDADRGYTLEVRVSNAPAIHLYEQLGFVGTGVRRGYYTDNREDAVIMWRDHLESWRAASSSGSRRRATRRPRP